MFAYVFVGLLAMLGLILLEVSLLWLKKNPVLAERKIPERMSNNDTNSVAILLENQTPFKLQVNIREELPEQMNLRDFVLHQPLQSKENVRHEYDLIPKKRGAYHFGNLNLFLRIGLGLIERKKIVPLDQVLKVYPSYHDLNKYDLHSLKTSSQYGIRKTRRLGHSLEFEQIKEYVRGDNIRHINWKATAKRNAFMVNQYTDEKSKEVYCLIDTGRNMKAPFHGLALVDYAINSSLIILKNTLNSQDKAGVLSFNKKVDHFLKAEKRPSHIQLILEKLYNIKPKFAESDFSKLYGHLRRLISHRALLFVFTNFDNYDAFERQLTYLQAINKSHVLVVIFFKNKELEAQLHQMKVKDPVQEAIMEKQLNDKKRIVSELNKRRIQTILTSPEELTIDLLNKYLEIKAKALV